MKEIEQHLEELTLKAQAFISPTKGWLTKKPTTRKSRYSISEVRRKFKELLNCKTCTIDIHDKLECIRYAIAHVYKYSDKVSFEKIFIKYCDNSSYFR
jgi:hypothetical protein